jgi:hypothetical protein
MARTTKKNRYMGFSLGKPYYRYASSLKEAKNLLRKAALEEVGKYNFNEVAIEDPPGSNKYKKIATTIL